MAAPCQRIARVRKKETRAYYLAYFHPWVIAEQDACEHVPALSHLAPAVDGVAKKWTHACTTWLAGKVLTLEMRHVVQNFFAVTRARPNDKEGERNQSDEEISDQDLDVNMHELEELLVTTLGASKRDWNSGGRRTPRECRGWHCSCAQ